MYLKGVPEILYGFEQSSVAQHVCWKMEPPVGSRFIDPLVDYKYITHLIIHQKFSLKSTEQLR